MQRPERPFVMSHAAAAATDPSIAPVEVAAALAAAFAAAERWHTDDLTLFVLADPATDGVHLAALVLRLQYHNRQVWHYEDMGRSDQEAAIVRGWRGAMEHNKQRNLCINAIDALLARPAASTVPLHSESLGSLCDRITILQLKHMAFRERDAALGAAVANQRDELVGYAQELATKLRAGAVRVQQVPRLKLYLAPETAPVG